MAPQTRLWVRAAWQNFSIGVGRQVRTVREQRWNRDAMAAPRAAWEWVGRATEMWRRSAVGAGGNRYAIQRSRLWMSRADVGWDPKFSSTAPATDPIPSSIKFSPWVATAVELWVRAASAEFFHRSGQAGADGEGAAVENEMRWRPRERRGNG